MKIVYIVTRPDVGGAQTHIRELMAGFRQRHTIHLVTSTHGPLTQFAESLQIQVHLVNSLQRSVNPWRDLATVKELYSLLTSVTPDVVHVHSSKAGLLGRIAAKRARLPVVFTAHGWGFKPGVPASRRWLVWASEYWASRYGGHIICVSQYDFRLALKYHIADTSRMSVIYNGVPETDLIACPDHSSPTIVMTARFEEPKDQVTLLKAFAGINYRNSRAQLHLVGIGPDIVKSKELAHQLDVDSAVSFLGERKDVEGILHRAQLFVLLSRYEGLPISIIEAMRAGLPVLATNVGGVPELVEDDKSGILVPVGDVEASRQALQLLTDNADLRRQMGARGLQIYKEMFTADIMLKKTESVYEQVMAAQESR